MDGPFRIAILACVLIAVQSRAAELHVYIESPLLQCDKSDLVREAVVESEKSLRQRWPQNANIEAYLQRLCQCRSTLGSLVELTVLDRDEARIPSDVPVPCVTFSRYDARPFPLPEQCYCHPLLIAEVLTYYGELLALDDRKAVWRGNRHDPWCNWTEVSELDYECGGATTHETVYLLRPVVRCPLPIQATQPWRLHRSWRYDKVISDNERTERGDIAAYLRDLDLGSGIIRYEPESVEIIDMLPPPLIRAGP